MSDEDYRVVMDTYTNGFPPLSIHYHMQDFNLTLPATIQVHCNGQSACKALLFFLITLSNG